ncbi:hypothetical protein LTI14_02310 [Nesterenkonia sp. YGD6]|uniref:sigma factor-like helix-turn-helix DNA-binding protein n=1 Tax=Nesterenkonia sp. YGD6 TaxID=2901231 RepID=UPI001F4D0E2E|nr:sigma factor-like helix-turn-helix DNA-binding protein [Nesterenkonia sp. YGD6]MCH8562054.1 hypothetical protein [Nesterenkonia sp. YGD6]
MTHSTQTGPNFEPASLAHLVEEFSRLDPRQQDALLRHGYGQSRGPRTLAELGAKYNVTRERIRQLENRAKGVLLDSLNTLLPEWRKQVLESFENRPVVHLNQVARAISSGEAGLAIAPIILDELEFRPVKKAKWWYSLDPSAVQEILDSMSPTGPILKNDWEELIESSALPPDFYGTLASLIPTVEFGRHLVRKNSQRYDKIAAVLMDGPLRTDEIVKRTKLSANSVRSALDHYDDFISLLKSRWALIGTVEGPKYRSTLPAVLDILKEEGPQSYRDLVRKVTAVHDVSPWRVDQCLDNYQIGNMADGRIWLVEHGAQKPSETEPEQPEHMVAIGDRVGIRQTANYDHVRGSGFLVNKWLCWRLGLRAAPQSVTFESELGSELTITRTGQKASLSSVRSALEYFGVIEGCEFVITLDIERQAWSLNHTCPVDGCSAI